MTNAIAEQLCKSYSNSDGQTVSGNAALLHNIKKAGGLDHVIDMIQFSDYQAAAANNFADALANEQRSCIKKTG